MILPMVPVCDATDSRNTVSMVSRKHRTIGSSRVALLGRPLGITAEISHSATRSTSRDRPSTSIFWGPPFLRALSKSRLRSSVAIWKAGRVRISRNSILALVQASRRAASSGLPRADRSNSQTCGTLSRKAIRSDSLACHCGGAHDSEDASPIGFEF